MTALARVRPIPPSIFNFCCGLLGSVGATDLTLAPLNLNGYNLFWQQDHHRYYLTYTILPKADVDAALTGNWKQLRVRAVGLVGWWSDNNILFVLRSPVQNATVVALHNPRQRDLATQTLTATLKGVVAALHVEERFGIPYCVAFQDHSRGGLFGRVMVAMEKEPSKVRLILTKLDNGEVVVTAMAGRKVLGHLDPNTILNGDWDAVTYWVHSVVVDGVLFGK
jgi:hypothetical protein